MVEGSEIGIYCAVLTCNFIIIMRYGSGDLIHELPIRLSLYSYLNNIISNVFPSSSSSK
jgi:hypothetical protein